MTASSKSLSKLLIAVLLISAILYISLFGIDGTVITGALKENSGIKQGLDLSGGSVITYQADKANPSDDDMSTVVSMLRERLDRLGYTEATLSRQGADKIRVEIPNVDDPDEAKNTIGATAELTFRDKDNNVVLSGTDVKDAKPMYAPVSEGGSSEHYIQLKLSAEGQKKFSEATAKIAGYASGENYIAIMLDKEAISAPRVQNQIDSDTCIITGEFTAESAKNLADLIRAGKLPFALTAAETRVVGATLGDRALQTSMTACLIGIILVMLFILIVYRVPGLVADVALCAYSALVALALNYLGVNLSLPGIAGIVLGIGMAVDANVIIFERIKDELRNGKTTGAAIDAGFNRAFTSILDSNVTTLIAGVVLLIFGTGQIKGFAVTLIIGIVASMITAIAITRFLLRQLIGLNIRNPRLYGLSKKGGSQNA